MFAVIFSVMLGACPGSNTSGDHYTVSDKDGESYSVIKMPDGKAWTTENINIDVPGSLCYDSLDSNCDRFGRLYTWQAAITVCGELGKGWRLPSQEDCPSSDHLRPNMNGAR